jgi:hypothetical protein
VCPRESEVDFIGGGSVSAFLMAQVASGCIGAGVTCHIGCGSQIFTVIKQVG